MVVIGIPSAEDTAMKLWEAMHAEISVTIQKRNNGNDHEAFELIQSGKIDPVKSILSHRFPLSKGAEAFRTFGDYADGVIKPLIEFK